MNSSQISQNDLKKFGLTLSLILAVVSLVNFLKHQQTALYIFWAFSGITAIFALFWTKHLKTTYNIFIRTTQAIGWLNSKLILIFLYYLVITPIGYLMRLFKKDPLIKKLERDSLSYWENLDKPSDFKQQH